MLKLKLHRDAVGEHPVPVRDGTETCAADGCQAADNPFGSLGGKSLLPYGEEQLHRTQVPAQSEKTSALHPTPMVRDARPDLAPVWCPEGCGWFHSAPCYTRHHHDGWTPTPDSGAASIRRRFAADDPDAPSLAGKLFGFLLLVAVPAAALVTLYLTH